MSKLQDITKRDVIAFLLGAASATVAVTIIVALILSMFGYSVVSHYAPQPTFAAQPTFLAQPTFIPQNTFIPEPSFTPTNTATPTKTPTSTPTLTPTASATPTQLVQAGVEFGSQIAVRPDGNNNAQTSFAKWDGNTLYIYSSSTKVEYTYGTEWVTAEPIGAYTTCTFTLTTFKNGVINRCKVYVIGDNPTSFRAPGLVNYYQFYASSLPDGMTQYSQFATPVPSATQTFTPEATLPIVTVSATPKP